MTLDLGINSLADLLTGELRQRYLEGQEEGEED